MRQASCLPWYLSVLEYQKYNCTEIIQIMSALHWENSYSNSFQIELDMIVVTVFLSIFWTKWISIRFRKSKGKLSPRSYPIQFERKWNTVFFFSVLFFLIRISVLSHYAIRMKVLKKVSFEISRIAPYCSLIGDFLQLRKISHC